MCKTSVTDMMQKFRDYGKIKDTFRRSNLAKESVYQLYMTVRNKLSLDLEPLSKRVFGTDKKFLEIALSTQLPVEISSGNKFQILKMDHLKNPTHKKLGSQLPWFDFYAQLKASPVGVPTSHASYIDLVVAMI